MKKVTSSFVTGAIALVFAVLGYQTALLVHYAAVTRIVARQDSLLVAPLGDGAASAGVKTADAVFGSNHPRSSARTADAVFGSNYPRSSATYAADATPAESGAVSAGLNMADAGLNSIRSPKVAASALPSSGAYRQGNKNQRSAARAQQIYRDAVEKRAPESFRFDPNTASVEELMRLGFSQKQAQSIDNYRQKGGRFHRKEDFASSYVVADSVYRRLENYIDIPKLDINTADSAAFDALPGIGAYFARKMVEHRTRLGGYSYAEQLMDIHNFDQDRFDALKDLITLSRPAKPFRLWQMPVDSLAMHPYVGSATTARSIVFYRSHNPKEEYTVEGLQKAGILTPANAAKLSACFIARP